MPSAASPRPIASACAGLCAVAACRVDIGRAVSYQSRQRHCNVFKCAAHHSLTATLTLWFYGLSNGPAQAVAMCRQKLAARCRLHRADLTFGCYMCRHRNMETMMQTGIRRRSRAHARRGMPSLPCGQPHPCRTSSLRVVSEGSRPAMTTRTGALPCVNPPNPRLSAHWRHGIKSIRAVGTHPS
jgi:hypothetical protein